ncbi:MAG: PPC domain-containing protein [Myxococcales bacterium]|nr:PPC domain-containing protein [Myxococcales bacterium]
MRRRERAGGPWRGAPSLPALFALVALGAASAGCKGRSREERIRRTSDEAPVQVVTPAERSSRPRSTVAEREPNDQAAEANELALDALAHGRLEAPADVDRFRLTVGAPGKLTVMVTGVPAVDTVLELWDSRGALLARSDRGGAKVDEGVGGFAVDAGRYDVVVRAFVKPAGKSKSKKPAAPAPAPGVAAAAAPGYPSEEYELTATLAGPATGGELEPNFDGGTATDLTIGEPATGLVGWAGDVDVWKIGTEVLAASNALDLELSAVEGLALQLELRDGLGRVVGARKGGKGQPLSAHGWVPAEKEGAPPFLYVAVSADRSHPATPYRLSVTARILGEADEREGNDSPEFAQPLGEEGEPLRATWDRGDVDCFVIPVAAFARRVEILVDAEAPEAGATGGMPNLAIEVVVGGRTVATSDEPAGKAERALVEVPAGARALLWVRGAAKPGAPARYDVTWTQAQGDAMPPEGSIAR